MPVNMVARNGKQRKCAKRKLQDAFTSDSENAQSEEFEVDAIVNERQTDEIVEYEVKWTGYDTDDNT